MIIIHADRNAVTNFDNARMLELAGCAINAILSDARLARLAVYDTEERAQEVFTEILNEMTHRRVDIISMPEK